MAVNQIRRYISLYIAFFSKNFRVESSFKFDFLFGMIVNLLQQGVLLAFIFIIFGNVPELSGWGLDEFLLLFGFAMIPNGMAETFFNNVWMIPEKYVQRAELDRVLTRPLPVMFSVLADSNSFHAPIYALEGLIIVIIACTRLGLAPDFGTVMFMLLLTVCAALIIRYIYTIVASLSFWTTEVTGFMVLVSFSRDVMRYPLSIYDQSVRFIFIVVLPFAFTSFFPVTYLLELDEYRNYVFATPFVTIALAMISSHLFSLGLKHYSSGGG